MMIMGQTAAKAGGDRKKTRDGLASGSWNGILGDVKFQAFEGYKNQNKLAMPVTQYLDGKSQTVFPEVYRTAKPVYPFPGWK
jgi:branched-chain amino acid transport system substrate-binding protein